MEASGDAEALQLFVSCQGSSRKDSLIDVIQRLRAPESSEGMRRLIGAEMGPVRRALVGNLASKSVSLIYNSLVLLKKLPETIDPGVLRAVLCVLGKHSEFSAPDCNILMQKIGKLLATHLDVIIGDGSLGREAVSLYLADLPAEGAGSSQNLLHKLACQIFRAFPCLRADLYEFIGFRPDCPRSAGPAGLYTRCQQSQQLNALELLRISFCRLKPEDDDLRKIDMLIAFHSGNDFAIKQALFRIVASAMTAHIDRNLAASCVDRIYKLVSDNGDVHFGPECDVNLVNTSQMLLSGELDDLTANELCCIVLNRIETSVNMIENPLFMRKWLRMLEKLLIFRFFSVFFCNRSKIMSLYSTHFIGKLNGFKEFNNILRVLIRYNIEAKSGEFYRHLVGFGILCRDWMTVNDILDAIIKNENLSSNICNVIGRKAISALILNVASIFHESVDLVPLGCMLDKFLSLVDQQIGACSLFSADEWKDVAGYFASRGQIFLSAHRPDSSDAHGSSLLRTDEWSHFNVSVEEYLKSRPFFNHLDPTSEKLDVSGPALLTLKAALNQCPDPWPSTSLRLRILCAEIGSEKIQAFAKSLLCIKNMSRPAHAYHAGMPVFDLQLTTADGTVVFCNKERMTKYSGYLSALFGGRFMESNLTRLNQDCDTDVLKCIIGQIHGDDPIKFNFNPEQTLIAYNLADQLSMEFILNEITSYFYERIQTDFGFIRYALDHQLPRSILPMRQIAAIQFICNIYFFKSQSSSLDAALASVVSLSDEDVSSSISTMLALLPCVTYQ